MRNLAFAAAVAASSLLSAGVASAQTLVSTRVYGGAAGGDDEFRGAAAAPGGGYYLAGYIGVTTFPATGADIWVAKVDAGLNMVSSFTLNGSANGLDEAFDVAVGTDGMVYAVGATSVPGTGSVLWIGKFTSGLALVSSTTFTYGFSVANTSLDSVLVEPAGTLLVTGDVNVTGGSTGGRIWLARYSPSLVLMSSASFTAGFASEAGDALALASNGDIYIGGGIAPAPLTSHDLWIGKYSSALVFQASTTVAGAGGNSDMTRGLAIGSNGDVYAAGIINNSGATVDIFLGRYTANLAPVAATSVAGVAATNDEGEDLVAGYSGSLLLGGGFSENGQAENVFLGTVNESSLAVSSSRTFASAGSNVDVANSVVLDTGTGVALVSGRYIGTGRDGFLALYNVSPPANPPAAPSGLAGAAQNSSSIQWSWTDNSSDETGFRVMTGTVSLSGDLAANTTVWVQSGMGVNASSGSVFVRAFNSTGTADSGTASVYTLANVPVSLSTTAVYASSAALSWGANGNPVGGATSFRVHYSTSASFTPSSVSSTTGLAVTLSGLTGSTSYYARMDALNGDSLATAYTSTISFFTSTTTVAPPHVYYSSGTGAPAGPGMYYAAAAAPGGGYYVVGYSSSAATGADVLLAKVDASANPVSWTKYSGLAKGFDTAYGVGLSSAGDVYVVGATSITGVGMEWWLGRYDSSLVLLASAAYTYGFAGDGNSSADAVFVKADGTVIVMGDIWTSASPSGTRIWTVRFSPNFNVQATFGNGLLFGPEYADSMHVTASGEYYKFGALAPAALTSTDLFVARTSSGDVGISSVMVAGAGGNTDQARGGVIGANGDLYVTGIMNDSGLYNEAWIARYTPALVFVSSRVIAGSAGLHDAGNAIARGPGDSIVVAGQMNQNVTGDDIWLAQLRESDLSVISSTTLDNSNASDIAHALVVDTAAATAFLAGVSAPAQNGWYALWGLSAPPAAPTGFAGTALSSTSIRWSWADASTTETGFRVVSGTVSLSGDLPAGTTQWTQTGLLAFTSYGPYKAQAFNDVGTSDSAAASTTTLAGPGGTLASLLVAPASVALTPGATQPLTVTGVFSDASTGTVSGLVWFSSNTAVATVSGAGLVTGAGVGSTVITVSSGVVSATASVTVAYLPTGALQAAVYAVSPATGPVGASRGLNVAGTRFGGSTTLALERASGAGSWTAAASLPQARQHSKAVRLDDGRVLLAGGINTANASVILSSAAFYDAGANTWTPGPNMSVSRLGFALAKLPDGRVLAAGGNSTGPVYHASSEIYDPATNLWTSAGTLSRARSSFGAATLQDGRVFIAGGYDGLQRADTDLFDPATGSWTARAALPAARSAPELVTLEDGRVLAVGGTLVGGGATGQTDIWDPAANTWTTVSPMGAGRYAHRLALLPGNRVLALGGAGAGIYSSAEVYDVAADSWTSVASMSSTRYNPSVERLGGKIVVIGGLVTGGVNGTATAEAFDPATNAWTSLGSMATPRFETAAVRLGDGRVLAAGGGPTASSVTASVELLTLTVATITATGVLAPSSYTLTGTVSLAGAATGYWDVVARGPGEGRLSGGFKVNPAALLSLSVTPGSASLEAGAQQAFAAAGTYDNASTQTFTSLVVWTSSPTSVAVVSTAGVVTAAGAGTAVITASSGSIVATATVTVSAFPGPTGFAGAAQGPTSILWSWTDNASGELGYRVMTGTANVSGDLAANATSWLQSPLTPNTLYGPSFARAFNSSGTADSGAASVRTQAAAPTGTTVVSFSATAATVSWSSNGNPAGTTAELHKSTDNAAFSLFLSSPVSTVHDTSLLGCTSYYYKARYLNAAALASAFDATVLVRTADTVPAAPAGLTAEAVAGGRVAFTWSGSPTEGVTGYRLYTDGGTGAFDFGSPLGVFTSTESSWTSGVLASSAAYAFALRAVHRCGVEETSGVLAAAASTATLAEVRAAIKNPEGGKRIAGNRVTVMAELTSGTPGMVSQVVFQFRASTAAPWADIPAANVNHPNPDLSAPYFTHWDVTGLAQGPYQLRAVAYQGADPDPAPGSITVIVDAADPDITENVVAGEIRKQQEVNNAVVNTIAAGGIDAGDALAKIVLPPGAVNTTTVTVTVETNPTITTASPAGFAAVGSSLRIDLSNGQHNLSGGQTACLTFSYPTNVTDPNALSIMSLDEATGVWSRDFATTVNASSRTVTGCTPHFSIFAVFQGVATATLLDGVRLYPNPYKPNSGNVNEGKPFSLGDDNSGIIIDQLPQRVTIEIFSVSGRRVTKFDTAASGGRIRWNARNSDGRDAASGGYFAVISSPGMKPIVKKFIIIR